MLIALFHSTHYSLSGMITLPWITPQQQQQQCGPLAPPAGRLGALCSHVASGHVVARNTTTSGGAKVATSQQTTAAIAIFR